MLMAPTLFVTGDQSRREAPTQLLPTCPHNKVQLCRTKSLSEVLVGVETQKLITLPLTPRETLLISSPH